MSTTSATAALTPTRAVLASIESGAGSITEIAERTGLDPGVVSLVIDRLVASGHLTAERMQTGCPDGGCDICPSGSAGRPGCGASFGGAPTGPVMITLRRPPG